MFNKIFLDDIVWKSNKSRWKVITHKAEHNRILYANNHPLVVNKTAYWCTDEILILGYQLISNLNIYRTIYSNLLNKQKKNINKSVRKYVGNETNGFIRRLRRNLASRELLGIPILLVDNIKCIVQFL